MSHYNYKAYREYKGLADLARQTGEPEGVIEDMEYMANYFARLLGMNLNQKTFKRKMKKAVEKEPGEWTYEIGGEWSQ